MIDPQAIEAAANALSEHFHLMGYDSYRMAQAAIAAFLEASGVGRDAERYRFLKGNFGICRPFDELLVWHPDEIDDAIDAARGGKHV